jgi:hypothetical protein
VVCRWTDAWTRSRPPFSRLADMGTKPMPETNTTVDQPQLAVASLEVAQFHAFSGELALLTGPPARGDEIAGEAVWVVNVGRGRRL